MKKVGSIESRISHKFFANKRGMILDLILASATDYIGYLAPVFSMDYESVEKLLLFLLSPKQFMRFLKDLNQMSSF